MSDAHLPSDREDEEAAGPAAPSAQDGAVAERETGTMIEPSGMTGPALDAAADVSMDTAGPRQAGGWSPDHDQPMLDLVFPDQTPGPELSPAADGSLYELVANDTVHIARDGTDTAQDADGGDASRTGGRLIEVSPIFSALEAAEVAAEASQQASPALQMDAFDVGILLPPAEPMQDAENTLAQPEDLPQPIDPDMLDVAASESSVDTVELDSSARNEVADGPSHVTEEARPSELLQDAAARIAAEANATAAALENLKRLLVHKLPDPAIPDETIAVPNRVEESTQRAEPPPVPAYRPPAHLPVEPPPMVVPLAAASMELPDYEPVRRPAPAVGSFLAGFALSWIMGAVLYVYLTSG
jgi:hypothetical protein